MKPLFLTIMKPHSERVPGKMTHWAPGGCLAERTLRKIKAAAEISDGTCCAGLYEEDIAVCAIAGRFNIPVVHLPVECQQFEGHGEREPIRALIELLDPLPETRVVWVNACMGFLRPETIVRLWQDSHDWPTTVRHAVPITPKCWDESGHSIIDRGFVNTKRLRDSCQIGHAMMLCPAKQILEGGLHHYRTLWSCSATLEFTDVDTPDDMARFASAAEHADSIVQRFPPVTATRIDLEGTPQWIASLG